MQDDGLKDSIEIMGLTTRSECLPNLKRRLLLLDRGKYFFLAEARGDCASMGP